MKFLIRADASFEIGTGHLIRCLTLAKELRKKDARVVFVCREHPGHLCDMLASEGFETVRLPIEKKKTGGSWKKPEKVIDSGELFHSDWLGTDWETDALQTEKALWKDAPWDWAVVDHYALDARWEKRLRGICEHVMVIDDLADRIHDCDVLLDKNFFAEPETRYKELVPHDCVNLLGPKYALLRPEFRIAGQFVRMRGNGIARILVYFGGGDTGDLTAMTLKAFSSIELAHLLVDVVVGQHNPHIEKLQSQVDSRPGTRLFVQPEGFVELLLRADLCVGAAGGTTWERLCLDLPSIVVTMALNQEAPARELNKANCLCVLGKKEDITPARIELSVSEAIRRQNDARIPPKPRMVDGFGACRVSEVLSPSDRNFLTLRRVEKADEEILFHWANDPTVRKQSFKQDRISWEEHQRWFEEKIRSGETWIWILQTEEGLPVGQIRFEVDNGIADIGYSLDEFIRGRGWAKELIKLGIIAFKNRGRQEILQGRVKVRNTASCRTFRRLGFTERSRSADTLFFQLP